MIPAVLSKEDLIEKIKDIFDAGWHKSVKSTINKRNDGAVGNTLEKLLEIEENNLPIPNAGEWELKGQRKHTSSLLTLKHIEPSPQAVGFVSNILLPLYGWKHKEAGRKYPVGEMSFRSTTRTTQYTKRGFKIIIDRENKKIRFVFNSTKVDMSDPEIRDWLLSVEKRIGLSPISPEPYWGFDDLKYAIGSKLKNCFYVIADRKILEGHEYFRYERLLILTGFSFEKLLHCFDKGYAFVDFDARTGHNHGTKFRIRQDKIADLYENVRIVDSRSPLTEK